MIYFLTVFTLLGQILPTTAWLNQVSLKTDSNYYEYRVGYGRIKNLSPRSDQNQFSLR